MSLQATEVEGSAGIGALSLAPSVTLPLAAISSATLVIASVETLRIPLEVLGAHPLVPARLFVLAPT